MMAWDMAAQVGQATPSPHIPTPATRVKDFAQMNPLKLYGSKVDEDA